MYPAIETAGPWSSLMPPAHPPLDRCEVTARQVVGDPCTDRVQVNVGHARQHRRFIEQGLASEATFPEVPCTPILRIRLTGNAFVQKGHEPAQVAEPFPGSGKLVGLLENLMNSGLHVAFRLGFEGLGQSRPAQSDLLVGPLATALRIDAQDDVRVIAHHRPRIDAGGETLGEIDQSEIRKDNGAVGSKTKIPHCLCGAPRGIPLMPTAHSHWPWLR